MRAFALAAAAAAFATGCDRPADPSANASGGATAAPPAASEPQPGNSAAPAAPAAEKARWDLQSSGEGTALILPDASGSTALRLHCPAGGGRLLVNVPAFSAIGSEERMSFGSGGEVVALVADTRGDRRRGGVSGTGAVPDNLAALVGGPVAVSYGAQSSGPHPAPPPELARAFVAACGGQSSTPPPAPKPEAPASATPAACLVQGSERLSARTLRAVGTEPFWGARIEGRCVTYSHPEDQKGTRIWTRYTAGAKGGGTWSGALGGRRFELRTRAAPGCSDGMSDKRYPLAVELIVGGEKREGCAEPA